MNILNTLIKFATIVVLLPLYSCEEFVKVDTPTYKLDSQVVFANEQAAQSALTGMFNQLFNASFSSGGSQSVSYLAGLSADNFIVTSTSQDLNEFYQNNITSTNNFNLELWRGSYNIIYQANSLLEGIENNENLSSVLLNKIEGSARFVRAFTYFYLVILYDEIPLILNTNYEVNALAGNEDRDIIFQQITLDLESAANLLNASYTDEDRTQPNTYAALSLLARVHLFLGNWEEAVNYSSRVIEDNDYYELLENLDQVFLANSKEAIWQISPIGWGNSFSHTREGNLLIKTPTDNTPVAFSHDFLEIFDDNIPDNRAETWINDIVINSDTLHYPYKYKIQYDTSGEITEYSMVLRIAEQYLIRAEANAQLGEINSAISDINVIRNRAGISLIDSSQQSLSQEQVLEFVIQEHRKELFTEWGHRWLDLKRYNLTTNLENKEGSNFNPNSWFFPFPASEIMKNPNLTQNPGY